MSYTAKDISDAAGIPLSALNTLIQRGQMVPAAGRNGSGKPIEFSGSDALQAAVILALRCAKVPPSRAPTFWRLITSQENPTQVRLYVLERPDETDCDFKITLTADRPADVPEDATCIDVGDLMDQVIGNLEAVELRRLTGGASEYPWRQPFLSPNADAPWEVFVAHAAGEPDANVVAKIIDAIEAKRNLLAVSANQAAFASLCAAIYRVLEASEMPALATQSVH